MYLREVQGLRAVAALLVAVYHIWFDRVSGGVDAFFVIAGFFIFLSFFKDDKPSWSQVTGYYRKTFFRLLPSASIVTLATCLMFINLDIDSLWHDKILTGAAAAYFGLNWLLIENGTDYLAAGQVQSPFQQFWALSVQVQIYVGLPLAIYLWKRFSNRITVSPNQFIVLVLGATAMFFLLALWKTYKDQPEAYFDTSARIWEFLVGGCLALVGSRVSLSARSAKVLGYVSLIVLVSFAAVVPVANSFPGIPALIPVLCTCGIILAARNNAGISVLNHPVMQKLGDISFAFYLWHWPIFIYFRMYAEESPSLVQGLVIIGLSAVLAQITVSVFEKPFRFSRFANSKPVWAVSACIAIYAPAVLAILLWNTLHNDRIDVAKGELEKISAEYPSTGTEVGLVPDTVIVKDDNAIAYSDGCHQYMRASSLIECTYGNKEGAFTVVLVGGSHSLQWLPALRELAKQDASLKIVNMTKSSCLFSAHFDDIPISHEKSCSEWNRRALTRIKEISPDLVLTIGTRFVNGREFVPDGYREVWSVLSDAGIPVVALRDNPHSPKDLAVCVDRHEPFYAKCNVGRDLVLGERVEQADELPATARLVDLTDLFCDDAICWPVKSGVMVYRDAHHLTATFVRVHSSRLGDVITASKDALNEVVGSGTQQHMGIAQNGLSQTNEL